MRSVQSQQQHNLRIVALGIMGRSLLLNTAGHNFWVAGYDEDPSQGEALRKEPIDRHIRGAEKVSGLLGLPCQPRAVMNARTSRHPP